MNEALEQLALDYVMTLAIAEDKAGFELARQKAIAVAFAMVGMDELSFRRAYQFFHLVKDIGFSA